MADVFGGTSTSIVMRWFSKDQRQAARPYGVRNEHDAELTPRPGTGLNRSFR